MIYAWKCLGRQRFERGRYAVIPIQPAHVESIRCWRNEQMDILRQMQSITVERQQQYFGEKIWPSMGLNQPENILLGYLLDEQLIGYGGLVHIGWDHMRAEISFLLNTARTISEDVYERDFSNFLMLMKSVAFEELGFHRLFTETYAIRRHHIEVIEASGFQLEGVMREHVKIGGHFVDSFIHGCLKQHER